jgi:hypothetical protein
MKAEVEYSDEFEEWWDSLTEGEQETVSAFVGMLEEFGVTLGFPYCSDIRGAKISQLRELRPQHKGRPIRVLYAFDPRRMAILLIGGDKTGNPRWYDEYIPIAERVYFEHLERLEREGEIDGETI